MRIGKWRHRVTVWAPGSTALVPSADAFGQANDAPVNLGTFWAEVFNLNGRETSLNEQLKALTTHRVTLRNVVKITPQHWLDYEGSRLNVLSVGMDPKSRYYTLMCVEMNTGG